MILVSLQGRSLTLYEEVHTIKTKEKRKVHDLFLSRLKAMLPPTCKPIIVTDSGFRAPWFKRVEKLGWDWVGRIRNRTMMKQDRFNYWSYCKDLYPLASSRAKFIGQVALTKNNPIHCKLVLYKSKSKGRVMKNAVGERVCSSHSKKNANREREPWLLATSLPVNSKLAKQVVKVYANRMQIEEAFRDTKSINYGLGYELSGTKCSKRLQILLMIGALAALVLWVLGLIAIASGRHRQYQANTVKNRNVLSVVYIGLRFAFDFRFSMKEEDIIVAANQLWVLMENHAVDW